MITTKQQPKPQPPHQDLAAARERRYCRNCGVEVTSTDFQAGYCTNCKKGLRDGN